MTIDCPAFEELKTGDDDYIPGLIRSTTPGVYYCKHGPIAKLPGANGLLTWQHSVSPTLIGLTFDVNTVADGT